MTTLNNMKIKKIKLKHRLSQRAINPRKIESYDYLNLLKVVQIG